MSDEKTAAEPAGVTEQLGQLVRDHRKRRPTWDEWDRRQAAVCAPMCGAPSPDGLYHCQYPPGHGGDCMAEWVGHAGQVRWPAPAASPCPERANLQARIVELEADLRDVRAMEREQFGRASNAEESLAKAENTNRVHHEVNRVAEQRLATAKAENMRLEGLLDAIPQDVKDLQAEVETERNTEHSGRLEALALLGAKDRQLAKLRSDYERLDWQIAQQSDLHGKIDKENAALIAKLRADLAQASVGKAEPAKDLTDTWWVQACDPSATYRISASSGQGWLADQFHNGALLADAAYLESSLTTGVVLPIPAKPTLPAGKRTRECRLPKKGEWYWDDGGSLVRAMVDYVADMTTGPLGGRRWIVEDAPAEKPAPLVGVPWLDARVKPGMVFEYPIEKPVKYNAYGNDKYGQGVYPFNDPWRWCSLSNGKWDCLGDCFPDSGAGLSDATVHVIAEGGEGK
jgi:hypothetical protein